MYAEGAVKKLLIWLPHRGNIFIVGEREKRLRWSMARAKEARELGRAVGSKTQHIARAASYIHYEEQLGGGALDLTVTILSNYLLDIYVYSTALNLGQKGFSFAGETVNVDIIQQFAGNNWLLDV